MAEGDGDLVELAARRLVALLERNAPGLVIGLHLVGSASDGDFRPGRSDLDFVAVLAHPAADNKLEALAIIHRTYAADPTMPSLDGIWITVPELASGPDECADGPISSDNAFFVRARGNRNPVTWLQLQDARTIFGTLDRTRLWSDRGRLVDWVRQNADGYWRNWHVGHAGRWSGGGLAMLRPGRVTWCVLGICRLAYTVETGQIASKSAAGEWALGEVAPQWHPIVTEALRIRSGQGASQYANPFRRRREALDFLAMMIARVVGNEA